MTRFADPIYSGDAREGVTGTALVAIYASFDPTASSQVLLGALPVGAVPVAVQSLGGATGGTNPTVKIGTAADDDAYGSIDADDVTALLASGAGFGVAATAVTPVYGLVGASAATGGTTKIVLYYVRP